MNKNNELKNLNPFTSKKKNLKLSFKKTYNLSKNLLGREIIEARIYLQKILEKKEKIYYTKFFKGTGHKFGKKVKFSKNCTKEFLEILNNHMENLKFKKNQNLRIIRKIKIDKQKKFIKIKRRGRGRYDFQKKKLLLINFTTIDFVKPDKL